MEYSHAPSSGWARRLPIIALCAVIAVAALLRAVPHSYTSSPPTPLATYRPVAVALGLVRELPAGATLATYVYALAYAIVRHVVAAVSPAISALDWSAAFVSDPTVFSSLARTMAIEAGVIAVSFAYILLARLVDPWAGIAAAFILAVHPSVIALSYSLGSASFCLVFFLLGLVIFCNLAARTLRPVEFAAAGLALGFATETMPVAWAVIVTLFVWLVHSTPVLDRRRAAIGAALCFGAFLLAAFTVRPGGYAVRPDLMLLITARAAVGLAAVAAMVAALRLLHISVSRKIYASLVLGPAIIASFTLVSRQTIAVTVPASSPPQAASAWIARGISPGTAIAMDMSLRDRVIIPRTPGSWARELQTPAVDSPYTREYVAAAVRAAAHADQAYDVIWLGQPSPGETALLDSAGHEIHPAYLVMPDPLDPDLRRAVEASGRDLWLVARFRPSDGAYQSVAIWGLTEDVPPPAPARVWWRMTHSKRIAAVACPASDHSPT